ncbi:MAG: EthD family reductase [Betaproteobacteria bacterium]|nr:EthD family reductase [Betaproteobacteria bacterium]
MAKLIALYKKPADAARFDAYYYSTHVPIAKKIPGLRRYEVSTGPVASPAGESAYHLVATLGFDSLSAIQQALGSPEGAAAAADLGNFAQAGVDLLFFDSKDI